ncbi:hypothetical protein [Jatrophihabitans sp.]|jgi:cholesterol oxidase|uniref:hypothetical protein n=1 Tax=Jatrophihabitans sp. TaxID=1932789 RepID=UPI002F08FA34
MRVRFTEEMRGFHNPGSPAYDAGYVTGNRDWHRISFRLTIGTGNLAAALRDPAHRMSATGFVRCRDLNASDMPVENGSFDLFAPGGARGRALMRYRLPITTASGPMTLLGFKDISNDRGMDMWLDTTTLFIRLVPGIADFDAPPQHEYSRGILRLNAPMLARQLLTFRGTPAGIVRFLLFFQQGLRTTYGRPPRKDLVR